MTIGAYKVFVGQAGKFYVGSSRDVEKRFKRHRHELSRFTHHCAPMQIEWANSGFLRLEIIETDTREEAYALEQLIIDSEKESDLLLNVGLSVQGGDNLSRNPKRSEIIRKMTESVMSRYASMAPEELKKLGEATTGERNGMFGKTHTPEARKKISEANKGKPGYQGERTWITDSFRENLSQKAKQRTGEKNNFFGRTHSAETKRLIAEKAKSRNYLPPNSRKVSVNGVEYVSLTEAARKTGIAPALMVHRLQSTKEKYKSYVYVQNA